MSLCGYSGNVVPSLLASSSLRCSPGAAPRLQAPRCCWNIPAVLWRMGWGGVGQRGKWTESENWHLLRILLIRLRCDAALGQSGWPTLVPSGSQDDSHWSHHGPATGVILAPASVFTAKVVASEKGQAGGINGSHDPDQDPMRRADGVTSRGWRTCCRDAAAGVPGHIGRKGHVTPARPVFLAAKPLLCTSTA